MGKKRRILTRTAKFAKKYFEFLDQVDETTNVIDAAEDDDIIEVGDPFIDGLVVTDRDNQTVKLSGRTIGFAQGEKIQWSFDGEAFKPDAGQVITHTGTGLDKLKIDETVEATAVAGFLTPGKHKVRVRKLGETNKSLYATAEVTIRQHKITIGGLAAAFTEAGDQISFDASELTISGKRVKGVNKQDAALGNSSTNKIKIEVSTGANFDPANVVKIGANADAVTIAVGQNFNNADNDDTTLLHQAVGGDQGTVHTFTVRVTPFDTDDVELTDSAAQHTLTVTKD